eukprot:m.149917 g.149917  ORF g.149917 m.149917 type:complete len:136 (+) comp15020_c0_seq7:1035-1442(+)
MKYFETYLRSEDCKEISVHCDVKIFNWLINYTKMHSTDSAIKAPVLTSKIVVSILISSDFLQMHDLVEKCLRFCHANMNAVIKAPSNMDCIPERLVKRLSEYFNHDELRNVIDPKDKFRRQDTTSKNSVITYLGL